MIKGYESYVIWVHFSASDQIAPMGEPVLLKPAEVVNFLDRAKTELYEAYATLEDVAEKPKNFPRVRLWAMPTDVADKVNLFFGTVFDN